MFLTWRVRVAANKFPDFEEFPSTVGNSVSSEADVVKIQWTNRANEVFTERVAKSECELEFSDRKMQRISSDNVKLLTNVERLDLSSNLFDDVPKAIARLPKLRMLLLTNNQIFELSPTIGRLTSLTHLGLSSNHLVHLPRALGLLQNLVELFADQNRLESVPAELGRLRRLQRLSLTYNRLRWLPEGLLQLPESIQFDLYANPVHKEHVFDHASLSKIIVAATHIGTIRGRATEICVGLQDLELPALVTLAIVDESVHENSIRMWAKWELITTVKHYRERCGALRGARRAPTIKDEGEDLVLIESENHRYENPFMYPSDERLHWAKRED
jgi:Leucine-rich repeat (LRR) protein